MAVSKLAFTGTKESGEFLLQRLDSACCTIMCFTSIRAELRISYAPLSGFWRRLLKIAVLPLHLNGKSIFELFNVHHAFYGGMDVPARGKIFYFNVESQVAKILYIRFHM